MRIITRHFGSEVMVPGSVLTLMFRSPVFRCNLPQYLRHPETTQFSNNFQSIYWVSYYSVIAPPHWYPTYRSYVLPISLRHSSWQIRSASVGSLFHLSLSMPGAPGVWELCHVSPTISEESLWQDCMGSKTEQPSANCLLLDSWTRSRHVWKP